MRSERNASERRPQGRPRHSLKTTGICTSERLIIMCVCVRESMQARELLAKKHEAQALMSEMECTTQAFEEAQEQNIRLLQQLKVRVYSFMCLCVHYF